MKKFGRLALPTLGASALVIASATAALASATITTVDGTPYTGEVRATNIGNVTLTGVSSLGPIITTCTNATLDAYIESDGTGGELRDVVLSGCTNNRGGTTTITAIDLPYSGGQVDYAPVAGGRDSKLTIFAPNPKAHVQAVLTLPALGIPSLTCHYGLTTSTPLVLDLFAYDNANKPVPSNPHGQGQLLGQSLQRLPDPTPDSRCPTSVSANGSFQVVAHPSGQDLVVGP
ncbi:hypothetical protein Arub01_01700 [Actinomadura rubrobrunea]|uniref:Secreted protein n=1 Tax=Actinomadura rubrobrunea TaxID=115335 RepID=A0A9W6PRY7_9ACTN|nr:hypothetical protein [Actinomadura rubrobrunea]GLW61926.1 hypothetical protein Arub01_01700 [Actinomadura rubrobrunea]